MRIHAALESSRGRETLWYEVDERYRGAVATSRLDGFAVAALLMAMERGEPELVVNGAMSEMLLHNLQRQVVPILRLIVPELHDVSIQPAVTESHRDHGGTAVVTGFSGGIDSFCTIADYGRPEALPGYRLTHLLFNNVGANGPGDRVFLERWNLIKDVAGLCGLEFVRVNSNLDDLLEIRFELTHVLRNASVVLMLQGLFGKYFYSSTYRFQDCFVGETTDLAYADPMLVPLLSTETLQTMSTGCQYSRVEKTRRALDVPLAAERLNVCVMPLDANSRNCSRCFKCVRTLVTLELLGRLDAVERVFDIEVYRQLRVRDQYLAMLPARTKDAFVREIFELTRDPAVKLPWHVSAVHALWPALAMPYRALRELRHLVGRSGSFSIRRP